MKKLAIFGGVIIAVFALLLVLNNMKNDDALKDNPYDKENLKQSTIDLIDDPNYQNIIMPDELDEKIKSGEPVTAYFFSPECGYCMEFTPRLMPVAEENKVDVVQYNVNEYQQGWDDYSINSTPTLIYFEDGKEVNRIEGAVPDTTVQAFFDQVVLK